MCEQKCKFKTCWTLSHLLADAVRYIQHEIFIFSFGQAKIYTTLSWARKIVAHCMRMERDDVRREMFRKTFIQYYIPGGWANAGNISSCASVKKVEWKLYWIFHTAVVGDLWLLLLFLGKFSTSTDLPLFLSAISRTHETSLDVAEELSVLVQLACNNSRPNSTDVVISSSLCVVCEFSFNFPRDRVCTLRLRCSYDSNRQAVRRSCEWKWICFKIILMHVPWNSLCS